MAPTVSLASRSPSNIYGDTHTIRALMKRLSISTSPLTNFLSQQKLKARQSGATSDGEVGTIIPTTYGQRGGLAPGAVAGIVLGAVFGVLLFIIVVAWAMQANSGIEPDVEERIEVRDRAPSPSDRRRRRKSSRRDYEVADIRVVRDASPRRSSHRSPRHSGTRTQIVEERIVAEPVRSRSRAPSILIPAPPMEEVYVDRRPRRRSGAEEVIVMEGSDFSSEPRKKRKSKRRSSGYRTVEPDRYAGGDHSTRSLSRRRDG